MTERVDPQKMLDSRALEKAVEALVRMDMHEKSCFAKHEEVRKAIGALQDDIKKALVWLVSLLLLICGFLIVNTFFKN